MARHDYAGFGASAWPRRDFQDDDRYAQRDQYTRPLSRSRDPTDDESPRDSRNSNVGGSYNSDWRGDISARDSMSRYGGESRNDGERTFGARGLGARAYGVGPQTRISPSPYGRGGQHPLDQIYGRTYGHGHRNEFDQAADQSDRTYGTRLGQGMNLEEGGAQGGERYGWEDQGYRYRYGEQEGVHEDSALTQITHRIGSFVKGVFSGKRPFRGPKGYTSLRREDSRGRVRRTRQPRRRRPE